VEDLEGYLGFDKLAVGGPVEPEKSPAMKKSIEARETKGKDTEKRVAQAHSSSETQPERNIAPIIPGQSVPERNFAQPGRSIPENTLAVKQASFQWADNMGRHLAHMQKQAAAEVPRHQLHEGRQKAAAAVMGIKLAHQIPAHMRQGLIEATAARMVKVASHPDDMPFVSLRGSSGEKLHGVMLKGKFTRLDPEVINSIHSFYRKGPQDNQMISTGKPKKKF
jgi:hypothetical protein